MLTTTKIITKMVLKGTLSVSLVDNVKLILKIIIINKLTFTYFFG